MNPYKYIKQTLQRRGILRRKKANSDFSAFVPTPPLTRKQLLIGKCVNQDVSISIDDPSEPSVGVYTIFQSIASEIELERRLNAKKAVTFSNPANVISMLVLIVLTITLAKSFM